MLIIRSKHLDIYHNLAAEEGLLEAIEQQGPILFLWQSQDTVVIGKNQIPWLECSIKSLREDGLAFARRLSGGGAVYHDPGNLNYAFFVPRTEFRDETQ